MQFHVIHTGNFKLDGGAMFGVVPKSIWERTNPADENNMCSWAMRCLLIEDGNRLILVDTGIGNKQSDKFFGYYYLHGDMSLESSLKAKGFSPDDITDVFLTHLHFDHCGGAIVRDGELLVPRFKNATYWSSERHWNWATKPNDREKASFLAENILPIKESGQLKFIPRAEGSNQTKAFLPGIDVLFVDGHTDSQMLPLISKGEEKLLFAADLLPSTGHIPLPYVMGYDTRPLITMEDRKRVFGQASQEGWTIFLEHDYINECCRLKDTEKGPRLDVSIPLKEVF